MIQEGLFIYFQDSDNPGDIANWMNEINSDDGRPNMGEYEIDQFIGQLKRNFPLSASSRIAIENLENLKKELDEGNTAYYLQRFYSFFALLDFIQRNFEKYPHTMKWKKAYHQDCSEYAEFEGFFGEMIQGIQGVDGCNPLSFYKYPLNSVKFPILKFDQSLCSTVKKLEYYVGDEDFSTIQKMFNDYQNFSKKCK